MARELHAIEKGLRLLGENSNVGVNIIFGSGLPGGDTGPLTETVALVDYYVAHPELYSDLSPFVTAERLTSWKNKILAYLAGA